MKSGNDLAFHITKQQMFKMIGKDLQEQATVEEPQLYISGQSRSTLEDQMKFNPTRQQGLRELRYPVTESGVHVWDIMQFMKGDNPATEFEDSFFHSGY